MSNLTAPQAADYLGLSTAGIYLARLEGRLTGYKEGGHVFFKQEDLDEFRLRGSHALSQEPRFDTLSPPQGDVLSAEGEDMTQTLLTATQAGDYLGVTPDAIHKAVERGSLQGQKNGSRLYFSRSDLDTYNATRQGSKGRPRLVLSQPRDDQGRFGSPVAPSAVQEPTANVDPHTVSKKVTLTSGFLAVSYSLDLFEATEQERYLILNIIDAIKQFERRDILST